MLQVVINLKIPLDDQFKYIEIINRTLICPTLPTAILHPLSLWYVSIFLFFSLMVPWYSFMLPGNNYLPIIITKITIKTFKSKYLVIWLPIFVINCPCSSIRCFSYEYFSVFSLNFSLCWSHWLCCLGCWWMSCGDVCFHFLIVFFVKDNTLESTLSRIVNEWIQNVFEFSS